MSFRVDRRDMPTQFNSSRCLVSEVVTTGCVPHEHSNNLSFFTLGTAPIQKPMIDYTHLHPKPGRLLASVSPSLTHFTMTAANLSTLRKFRR
jgi:hypothetical protein